MSHFRDLLKPPETSLQLFAYTTYVYCKESQNNVALSPWRQENFHWLQCVSFAILFRSPCDCGVEWNFPLKRFTVSENATWLQINTKCVLGAGVRERKVELESKVNAQQNMGEWAWEKPSHAAGPELLLSHIVFALMRRVWQAPAAWYTRAFHNRRKL